jgi:hypothetical protein
MGREERLALIHKPFVIRTHGTTARWAGCNTGGYLIADYAGGRRATLGDQGDPEGSEEFWDNKRQIPGWAHAADPERAKWKKESRIRKTMGICHPDVKRVVAVICGWSKCGKEMPAERSTKKYHPACKQKAYRERKKALR